MTSVPSKTAAFKTPAWLWVGAFTLTVLGALGWLAAQSYAPSGPPGRTAPAYVEGEQFTSQLSQGGTLEAKFSFEIKSDRNGSSSEKAKVLKDYLPGVDLAARAYVTSLSAEDLRGQAIDHALSEATQTVNEYLETKRAPVRVYSVLADTLIVRAY